MKKLNSLLFLLCSMALVGCGAEVLSSETKNSPVESVEDVSSEEVSSNVEVSSETSEELSDENNTGIVTDSSQISYDISEEISNEPDERTVREIVVANTQAFANAYGFYIEYDLYGAITKIGFNSNYGYLDNADGIVYYDYSNPDQIYEYRLSKDAISSTYTRTVSTSTKSAIMTELLYHAVTYLANIQDYTDHANNWGDVTYLNRSCDSYYYSPLVSDEETYTNYTYYVDKETHFTLYYKGEVMVKTEPGTYGQTGEYEFKVTKLLTNYSVDMPTDYVE